MRYFMTGATGFIGGRVARQLRAAGHDVVALVRDPGKARTLSDLGVTLAPGDITDKESMRAPMAGVDGVFHIAGWYHLGRRHRTQNRQVNVQGTRNVLEVMRDLHIPRGVYTSTLAVFSDTHGQVKDESYRFDGRHLSEYDRTKWVAHYRIAEPLMRAGLPLIIVQPGAVYGPGDSSALSDSFRMFLQGRFRVVPAGAALTWGHVDDIARGHILAMERGTPGESYILAGPAHTLAEVFAIAAQITGLPAPREVSPRALRALAHVVGGIEALTAPLSFVRVPEAYTAEGLREIAGVTYLGRNDKARTVLGFEPRALETGLRETLTALQQELAARR